MVPGDRYSPDYALNLGVFRVGGRKRALLFQWNSDLMLENSAGATAAMAEAVEEKT